MAEQNLNIYQKLAKIRKQVEVCLYTHPTLPTILRV